MLRPGMQGKSVQLDPVIICTVCCASCDGGIDSCFGAGTVVGVSNSIGYMLFGWWTHGYWGCCSSFFQDACSQVHCVSPTIYNMSDKR